MKNNILSFWESESKKENKTIQDVIQDFYDERDKEEKMEEERLKQDKNTLFSYIREYYEIDPEASEYEPLDIISVELVSVRYNMSKDTTSFVAWIKCSDNKDRLVKFTQINYYGSYMDPPDCDADCQTLQERNSK